MHCVALCLVTIFTITHGLKFPGLPTTEDIKKSKVIYHKKKVCLLIPGKENCVYNDKTPGDPEEVASFIQIHQFGTNDNKENLDENDKADVDLQERIAAEEEEKAEEDEDEPPAEIHKVSSDESTESQEADENEE